jgi:hypothetical protein
LVSDHRLVVERISSGEFVHALEISVSLASCLLRESDLFEEVSLTYDVEIGLCYLGANYQFGAFELALFLVSDLYLCHPETSQS